MDAQIAKLLRKYEAAKNPRALNKLYSYRSPISRNIQQYLTLLGLDKKPPPQKTLEEILSEDADSNEGVASNGGVTGDESDNGGKEGRH